MLDLFRTLSGALGDVEDVETVREAIVFAAWRRIVGEGLAEHAVATRLEASRLTVAVSNLTWQRHLKDLCGQMLFKLNASLGTPTVSFIDLVIDEPAVLAGRRGTIDSAEREEQFRRLAEAEISPELNEAAASIEDPELRRQFTLAAGKCLVRRRQRK